MEEPRDEPSKVLWKLQGGGVADETRKCKGCGNSLTGITSGGVKKRQLCAERKVCGIFAKDWPEWLTVEGAFDLDLECVCVRDATFVDNLVIIYPKTTFIMWEMDIVLTLVIFVFSPLWLPPPTNKIWHCDVLEVMLASAEKF
jgi:hypothetical protein